MKRLTLFVTVFALLLTVFSSCTRVPAGYKGVKVYLYGQNKGVDHEILEVGKYRRGINVEYYTYPVFTQNYTWTENVTEGSPIDESIDFQTKEGLTLNADFGITYHLDADKISILFETFRRGVDEITDIFLRNMVRDALNKYASTLDVENVYGVGKNDLISKVEEDIRSQVAEKGIVIEKVYLIGNFRLPTKVYEALNAKIEATQKAQQRENEVKEAEAKAKKDVAYAEGKAKAILVEAEAQAEANQILSKSITPTLVDYMKAKQWDGKLPKVTGNSGTLVDLR